MTFAVHVQNQRNEAAQSAVRAMSNTTSANRSPDVITLLDAALCEGLRTMDRMHVGGEQLATVDPPHAECSGQIGHDPADLR